MKMSDVVYEYACDRLKEASIFDDNIYASMVSSINRNNRLNRLDNLNIRQIELIYMESLENTMFHNRNNSRLNEHFIEFSKSYNNKYM